MSIKALFPKSLKRSVRLAQRRWKDRSEGLHRQFANTYPPVINYPFSIALQQPIMPGETLESKLNNLRVGASRVNGLMIQPGELFSFWNRVGPPTKENGFEVGRNVVGGVLSLEVGGGLCQLSSLLYHLAMLSGMQVEERYPHSIDIYEEHERFTPLGADATVVYGYKDLRFRNPLDHPVVLTIQVEDDTISASLNASNSMRTSFVQFSRSDEPHQRTVVTYVDGKEEARSVYGILE